SVRVLRAGVDLELADQLAAQLVLGEHAPDSLLDGLARVLGEQVADGDRLQASGGTGVAVAERVLALVAGTGDLGSVDDDDEVTAIDVGCERRLVLAAQQRGHLGGETAKDDVFSINHMPVPGDLAWLWGVRGHGRRPTS